MKTLLSSLAALCILASATPALAATASWDNTVTVQTLQSIPTKNVAHQMSDRKAWLYVDAREFLRTFERMRYRDDKRKELYAAVQGRIKFMNSVDTSFIVVVPVRDEYIMTVIRPLFLKGKVAVLDKSTGMLVSSVTIRDHGTTISDGVYSGSIDYILPSGNILYSLPY